MNIERFFILMACIASYMLGYNLTNIWIGDAISEGTRWIEHDSTGAWHWVWGKR